ncbi:MAG: hypothetical protein V3V14_09100 [Saprospiraceae bacterium]
MKYSYLLLILLSSVLLFYSCEDIERTTLTSSEKKIVDSIYAKKVSYLRKEVDSVCIHLHKEIYDNAVDSLMTAYIKEIKTILESEN